MDPIKVDFSKKGGPKEIVIPPDKAALKIVLSVLCSLVTAGIAFYIMLPPLNFKAYEFYGFLAIIVASYAPLSSVSSRSQSVSAISSRVRSSERRRIVR